MSITNSIFFLFLFRDVLFLGLFIRIRTAAIIIIVAIVDRIKASKQRQRSSVIKVKRLWRGRKFCQLSISNDFYSSSNYFWIQPLCDYHLRELSACSCDLPT